MLCDLPAGAARESATTALRLLREPAAPAAGASATAAAPAPAPAPPKRDVRGVQLNMDGLLGRKEQEDQYIRALLLVDGITCVRARIACCATLCPRCHLSDPVPAPRCPRVQVGDH